jgi:hypothetical protein
MIFEDWIDKYKLSKNSKKLSKMWTQSSYLRLKIDEKPKKNKQSSKSSKKLEKLEKVGRICKS